MPEAVNRILATAQRFSPEHSNATKGKLSEREANSSIVETPLKQVLKLERGKDVHEATKLEAEETSNKVTELLEASNTTKTIIKKKSMIKKSKSVNAKQRLKHFINKNTGKLKCTSLVKADPSKLTSPKNPEVSEVTDIPSTAENVKVHRLVVEGLPKNTSERDLNNSFNKAKSVHITKSTQGNKLLCNGFIEFANLDDFNEALAIKNRRINGKYVQVMKEECLVKKRPFYKRSHSPHAKRIKVDAVSNDICNEDDSDDAENDTSVDEEVMMLNHNKDVPVAYK
ncbi:uncharacterized protein [Procambarus clarkii]|uniref:uncharacterized protein n=1 Tax=Procambarus clarkii TaxID=6728 RepID=UPI003743323B